MEIRDFSRGEYVVYGGSGICLIEDIKKISFTRTAPQQSYFILRPLGSGSSTIYVPIDSEPLRSRMRYVLSKAEIDALLRDARDEEILWIDDRKERSVAFHEILSRSVQKELLLLIRCIYLQRKSLEACGRKLAASDNELCQSAEKVVREEFAFALGISPEDVGGYIRDALGIGQD